MENNNANINNNQNNNSNNKKDDLIFYTCCLLIIGYLSFIFQSIELFIIALLVLIIFRRKFLYVVIGTISLVTIVGIIAFGLCIFSIFNM